MATNRVDTGSTYVPNSLLLDPQFWQMGESRRATLLVLLAHRNRKTGLAWPSQDTIAKMIGRSRRTVWGSIKDLEAAGMIQCKRGRMGGGRVQSAITIYRFPCVEDTVVDCATRATQTTAPPHGIDCATVVTQSSGRCLSNSRSLIEQPVTVDCATAVAQEPKENHKRNHHQRRQIDSGPKDARVAAASAGCAEAATPAADVIAALMGTGIGEPTRTDLASMPGITADIITSTAATTQQLGGGIGMMVNNIKAAVEANRVAIAHKATQARLRAVEAERVSRAILERNAAERLVAAEDARVAAYIDSLSQDEQDELRQQAVGLATNGVARQAMGRCGLANTMVRNMVLPLIADRLDGVVPAQ